MVTVGLTKSGQSLRGHCGSSFGIISTGASPTKVCAVSNPSLKPTLQPVGPAALAQVVGKKQKRKFNPMITNPQLLLTAFALHIFSQSLSKSQPLFVSQGQLEANKHFLAGVEDKQTVKC